VGGFTFDTDALVEVGVILESHLAPIEIADAFTEPLVEDSDRRRRDTPIAEHLRVYTDSYIDLLRLLEEIRFELALAALLLRDYTLKRERGEAPERERPKHPLPVESTALLRRYFREVPSPEELFHNPYAEISGNRILGRWFAGQLLDSVLYRTVASSDRLAILLWTRAELPLEARRDGQPIHPAFRRRYLDQLADRYSQQPAWEELVGFLDYPLFETAKNLRDGFTHSRRIASQLHGDDLVVYASDYARGAVPVEAIDAADHLALGLAGYDAILRPLVRLTGELLSNSRAA
jgi:hypothetical protein